MILSPPCDDLDQTLPVTTTFDPPPRHARHWPRPTRDAPVDWERVATLYAFVRARALEHLRRACDVETRRRERQHLQAIDAMFAQARRGHRVVEACAVTYFRSRAMRDACHPDFLGQWLGRPAF